MNGFLLAANSILVPVCLLSGEADTTAVCPSLSSRNAHHNVHGFSIWKKVSLTMWNRRDKMQESISFDIQVGKLISQAVKGTGPS